MDRAGRGRQTASSQPDRNVRSTRHSVKASGPSGPRTVSLQSAGRTVANHPQDIAPVAVVTFRVAPGELSKAPYLGCFVRASALDDA